MFENYKCMSTDFSLTNMSNVPTLGPSETHMPLALAQETNAEEKGMASKANTESEGQSMNDSERN